MNALEFVELVEGIIYKTTLDCTCPRDGSENSDCPLFKPEKEIRRQRNLKAQKILKETFPDVDLPIEWVDT